MPMHRYQVRGWSIGAVTLGIPENVPDQALRVARNVRINLPAGTVTTRPGSSVLTTAITSASVKLLHRRSDDVANTYAQVGLNLYRLSTAWQSPSLIHTFSASDGVVSVANMIDGLDTVHVYVVGETGDKVRDNGSAAGDIGIPAPLPDAGAEAEAAAMGGFYTDPTSEFFASPISASLDTDLYTAIESFDTGAGITYDGWDTNPVADPLVKQEGAGSIRGIIAAQTIAEMGRSASLDLSAFTEGIFDVSDDDYISFQVRADHPDFIGFIQLEFDLDTTTLAAAFRNNYYSLRVSAPSHLNQGPDQWTHVQQPKSAFARFGANTALTWANVKCWRILVSNEDTTDDVTVYFDDLKMRGGTDLVGDVSYCVVYQDSTTGTRSNPLITDGKVIFSEPVTTNRQFLNIDLTDVRQGGASHPGDTRIDTMLIYRRINNGEAVLIDTVSDTVALPYRDETTELETLLAPSIESNNHLPPETGRYLFGPGATNRLWMFAGRNQVYFSKTWELGENRAENWPENQYFSVGDGSEYLQAGLCTDTEVLIWSDQQTYEARALGTDIFLPVAIPNSRGLVGKHAIAEGDGRVFFLASDGIYQHAGLTQRRLTETITPFFAGEEVSGILPLEPDYAHLCQLQWHPDPYSPMLILLYPQLGSTTLDGELILKRNLQSGDYTDISFDSRATALSSIYSDPGVPVKLLGGDSSGRIVWIEQSDLESDAGSAIEWQIRTRAFDFDSPQQPKRFDDLLLDADTQGDDIDVAVEVDASGELTELGQAITSGPTAQASFASLSYSVPPAYSLGVDIQGSGILRCTMKRLSLTAEKMAPLKKGWVSSVITNRYLLLIRHLFLDITAEEQVDCTLVVDDLAMALGPIMPQATRQSVRLSVPGSAKGFRVQVRLSSEGFFALEEMRMDAKPLGQHTGFNSVSLAQEIP